MIIFCVNHVKLKIRSDFFFFINNLIVGNVRFGLRMSLLKTPKIALDFNSLVNEKICLDDNKAYKILSLSLSLFFSVFVCLFVLLFNFWLSTILKMVWMVVSYSKDTKLKKISHLIPCGNETGRFLLLLFAWMQLVPRYSL